MACALRTGRRTPVRALPPPLPRRDCGQPPAVPGLPGLPGLPYAGDLAKSFPDLDLLRRVRAGLDGLS